MKNKKNLLILFIVFSLFGCTKNDEINPRTDNQNTEQQIDYAPTKLIGKTLNLQTSGEKYYSFMYSGTCKIDLIAFTLTNTPTYSYIKTKSNTASFSANYKSSYMASSPQYASYTSYNCTYTLTFTSESGGTYSGSWKSISTGFGGGTINKNFDGVFSIY